MHSVIRQCKSIAELAASDDVIRCLAARSAIFMSAAMRCANQRDLAALKNLLEAQ
jgi:hypothetical protein